MAGLDPALARRAVDALLQFHSNRAESRKQQLLDDVDGEVISLQVGLRRIPDRGRANPLRINLPHSIRDADTCRMCIFVKEDAKKDIQDALRKKPVPGLSKVIGLQKLRTHYARYAERRELCSAFDFFLCDDRVLPMMPKVLGKEFFQRKKQPISVSVTRKGFSAAVVRARDSTYLHLGWGPCCAVQIATTAMDKDEITENVLKGMAEIANRIPKKWSNIQAVHMKTAESVALPLYQYLAPRQEEEKLDEAAEGEEGAEGKKGAEGKVGQKRKSARSRDAAAASDGAAAKSKKRRKAKPVAAADLD